MRKMRWFGLLGLLVGLVLVSGCGILPQKSIKDQPLQGVIDGKPWKMKMGTALLCGDGMIISFLERKLEKTCGFWSAVKNLTSLYGSNYAQFSSPYKKAGRFELKPFHVVNLVFYTDALNVLRSNDDPPPATALTGYLIIESVSKTHVKGGLYAYADGDNEINGKFEISVCDRPEAKMTQFKGRK